MLRILPPFQSWSRVPPLITPKLAEICARLLNIQYSYCSTTVPSLDYKKPKYRRVIKGIQSPFKHHYNVQYTELFNFLKNHLPALRRVSVSNLNELMIYLKEKDYKWEEVKKDKEILLLSHHDVKQRLHLLREFAIPRPRLHDVLHIAVYVQSKVELLRTLEIYGEDFDLLDHIFRSIEKLELPDEVVHKIRDHFQDIDGYSLGEIHLYILVHYLCQRFMVDVESVKVMIRMHRLPTWKPLAAYPRICDIIIKLFKMDFSDVLDHPVLLNIEPENAVRIARTCPRIGGTPLVDLVKEHPQLLQVPHHKLSRWAHLFEKYKVTNFRVTPAAINLFKSAIFKEAEDRLQVLHKLPEFEIMVTSGKLISLLQKPHVIKKIIEMMHKGQVLTSFNSIFQDSKPARLQSLRQMPKEMKSYVAQELGIDEDKDGDFAILNEVKTNLGLGNTRLVLKLLLDYGFTTEQVMNGIQILGFDYASLKTTLADFQSRPETQPFDEWMKNPFVIHLLAYLVKKNTQHLW